MYTYILRQRNGTSWPSMTFLNIRQKRIRLNTNKWLPNNQKYIFEIRFKTFLILSLKGLPVGSAHRNCSKKVGVSQKVLLLPNSIGYVADIENSGVTSVRSILFPGLCASPRRRRLISSAFRLISSVTWHCRYSIIILKNKKQQIESSEKSKKAVAIVLVVVLVVVVARFYWLWIHK